MSNLGKAVIEFSADTAKFTGDIGRTAALFNKSMGQMERGISDVRTAITGLVGVGGLLALAQHSINVGEELNKLSQKAGISVESLSELKFSAGLADVGMDALAVGLKGFNKAIVEAGDGSSKSAQIFKALGVDLTHGPDAALKQVATRFADMKDGAEKSTLAVDLFGKAGNDMIPWLNAGADGLSKAAEQAKALGLTMSAEQAANFERYNDNMKTLGLLSQVVGTSIANVMVPGLNLLTQNLIQAAEKGNLLFQTLVEGAKVTLALSSALTPSWLLQGKAIDAATQALFNWDERQRSMRTGPSVWPGAASGGATGGSTNSEALACALSGGKWVGGKCVRAGAGAGKDTGPTDEERVQALIALSKDLAKTKEEIAKYDGQQEEAAYKTADALKDELDPTRELYRQQAEILSLQEQGLLTDDEANKAWEERQLKLYQLTRDQTYYADAVKKTDDFAKDMGLTFTSAFENAIAGGESFRDVLKGIDQDIARIIIRKAITEPAGNAISKAVSDSGIGKSVGDFFGNLFGGGKAIGGPVTGGTPYLVGEQGPELFVPGGSGSIVPNDRMGAGGPTIVVHVDSRVDAASVAAAARQGAAQGYAMAIQDARSRGTLSRSLR